ncbi:hypothetical protein [Christiangramia salexigens]|uniref:Lipoprotein n=1 Tax=Christiangramia salexigens TaxID=1913577 RepID=A0A1L3J5I8_9FLAO|nr:hypothetical protein [Christiangramia salexigens]APG60397.1 hypothetical protein LPB144_08255 [Christiangramia salexigens]
MKTIIYSKFRALLIVMAIAIFSSCSTEEVSVENEILSFDFQLKKAQTCEEQIEILTKAMRKFHNVEVAKAQGYNRILEVPFVPGMGYHYLNPDYVDGKFDLLHPELLVYYPGENGKMKFGAAEYLIRIENCDSEQTYSNPPQGFIGDEDHWHVNCDAGGWTLHAWVGLENEAGVFKPTNAAVPSP